MRITPYAAILFLAYAGASHAELGGPPTQFKWDNAAVAPKVMSAAPNWTVFESTLASGTKVREYVSAIGSVFAVSWNGPFMPDLRELLGRHFTTMVAESAKTRGAGRLPLVVDRPGVVIFSGGRMGGFEGRAWLPADLPAGFSASDIR